jgi:hypothetical protein
MKRRDFLSLFLLSPAIALAEDGLLFDAPPKSSGMLMDVDHGDGMLFDIPTEVIESQEKITVHLYSPKTWRCPVCDQAEKELKDHPGIKLVVWKLDERPAYFKAKNWPILHWGPGDAWVEGWPGKQKFLARLLGDVSAPPTTKPVTVKDSHGRHWSVSGDWNPSELKTENHLVHTHGFKRERIVALNLGQLLTLHDMVHEGRVNKNTVAHSQPTYCPT